MKKIFLATLLIISILISVIPAAAAGEKTGNILINGDFETIGAKNLPAAWSYMSGDTTSFADSVHGGKLAIRMESTENMYISQIIKPVADGNYTVSLWARLGDDNTNKTVQAAVKIEGFNSSKENNLAVTRAFDLTKRWSNFTFTFTTMPDQTHVNFLLRMFNGGVIYIDDVTVVGKVPEGASENGEYKVAKDAKSIPADGVQEGIDGKEYMKNGDFEDGDAEPSGWKAVGGSWTANQYVKYDKETAYSGSKSIKISTLSGGNPWINQLVGDLEPGATYQLTGWYNSDVPSASIICKLEFYSDNRIAADCALTSATTLHYSATDGAWKQMIANFTMPDTGKAVAIYPRLLSTSGTVYFDDFSVALVAHPSTFSLTTDEVFYYTGSKMGTALATLRNASADSSDDSISFTLTDARGNVISKKERVKLSNGYSASFNYCPADFSLKEEYNVTAVLYDSEGNEKERHSQLVYRYDRPTAIGEDGIYRVDGKPFYPTIVYHAGNAFEQLSKIGVTVVQGSNYDLKGYLKILDEADKYGMKILVTLYPGMLPAGNDANAEHTKEIVKGVMNHPAVFAYAVQDEPWANNPNCDDDLRKSYKLIRDMDPVHPIYLCECFENKYEISGKYVDVLCIDPYPSNAGHVGTVVADNTEWARAAVRYKKPVYVLSSVLNFGNFRPDAHEIRTQFYQTLLSGGSWGMYPYTPDNAAIDKTLPDSIFWPYLLSFYEKENKLFTEYFYEGIYPNFNKGEVSGCHYESFMKDGNLYIAAYNDARTPIEAGIPLVSANGRVTFSASDIEIINGSDKMNAKISGNALNVSLSATEAVLYKLTSSEAIDAGTLSETRFTDTADYSWAAEAVKMLEDRNIANGEKEYRPGESITRADFAMFLIKTLGFTTKGDVSFDDVDKDAYYGESILIGKTYGILNGVGDNKYSPEAVITRQDLMTIIARGLGLSGEADLSSYSDSENIADYAKESVSAMVEAGLITGNADGTLNPLGNATRAEAAVIMKRIIEKFV